MNRYPFTLTVALFLALSGCHHTAVRSPIASVPTPATAPDASTPAPVSANGPTPIPAGPLGDLDQLFVDSYTARRTAVIQNAPPFVVVSGSSLVLHLEGKKETVRVIPDIYHALKDIAHLPFTIYLQLSPVANSQVPLTDPQATNLREVLARIDAARKILPTGGYTPDELVRETQILDASQAIVSLVLQNKRIDRATLVSFARNMGPLMLMNANDAGCAQIQATHEQMMKWKDTVSADEWSRLIVLNRARHQARYRNAATQYFHWLLADQATPWSYPGESMRVIYVESLGPKEDASDELATILIDADASEAFFQDSWRLSEDILSSGAAECIKKLPDSDRAHR